MFLLFPQRTVYIKAVFLKIEDINTIQEYFSGLVFVKARWREPMLDSCIGKVGHTTQLIGGLDDWLIVH